METTAKGNLVTVVVQNRYFIKEEKHDEALAVRRRASGVRREAGRPVGRIIVGLDDGPEAPNFVWECDYPDMATRQEDAAWADDSPEFVAVRSEMRTLLERFERLAYEVDEE